MPLTAHLSLVSPDQKALLDVVEGAEAAFLEYGLAPDIGGVQDLTGVESTSTEKENMIDDDALPEHFSSEFVAEISQFDADKLHYVAMSGLPVIGRVVREEAPGRSSVVIQSNVQTGSASDYTVYRHNRLSGDYEAVSSADSRRPDQ